MDRRKFIKSGAIAGAFFVLQLDGIAEAAGKGKTRKPAQSVYGFFTAEEMTLLASLVNQVMPEAQQLGALEYIEGLLTAFEVSPPRIFAGGPYSGRQPLAGGTTDPNIHNSFADFIPLDRSQEYAWRMRLYGSKGIPGGDPNEAFLGTKIGLRDLFKTNLQMALHPQSNASMSPPAPDYRNLHSFDADFRHTLSILVVEGCFSAPEYGGNHGLQGWKMIHFEGDVLPRGFAEYNPQTDSYIENPRFPVSGPNPGIDPNPLDATSRKIFGVTSTLATIPFFFQKLGYKLSRFFKGQKRQEEGQ